MDMNLHEIAENSGYNTIGIRAMTGGVIVEVGQELESSFVWVDGQITSEQLEGVSAIDCGFDGFDVLKKLERALELVKAYRGQLVLIGTNAETYEGNDVGEVVMPSAVVIATL
jgi:hypothetical protein